MAEEERMNQVVITYPEDIAQTLQLSGRDLGAELAFLAAAKLYELGRLSADRAARLAGLDRETFLSHLAGVSVSSSQPPIGSTGVGIDSTATAPTIVWADRAAILAGFDAALVEAGIDPNGLAMTPEELQRYLLAAGIKPEENLLTNGIIAARDE